MLVLISALLLGLMGSFHCAGMCGPIAIALPLHGNRLPQKIYGGVLYNLGRTLTYGLMGAVFGLLGQGVRMIGFQQKVSIIMGAIMGREIKICHRQDVCHPVLFQLVFHWTCQWFASLWIGIHRYCRGHRNRRSGLWIPVYAYVRVGYYSDDVKHSHCRQCFKCGYSKEN